MTAPNMAAITASLERSLQSFTLNHHESSGGEVGSGGGSQIGIGRSSSSDSPENRVTTTDAALELNSNLSLPYHWEQCLDLKTGEIYYINWSNGMKAKEDPRAREEYCIEDFYDEEDEDEDDSSCGSEESSSESSPPCLSYHKVEKENHVLVVAGCKTCLMYFMVPKQVEDCPKCTGQLLHFDRSENGSQ